MNTKPAETPRSTAVNPYDRPKPSAKARASIEWTLPLSSALSLVEAAPNPVYTVDAPPLSAESLVAVARPVADIVVIVEVLTLVGF